MSQFIEEFCNDLANINDNFLNDYPITRTIDIANNDMFQNIQLPAQMKLTICKGIAGFDMIKNKEVITNEHTGY